MEILKIYFAINTVLLIREIYIHYKYSPNKEEEAVIDLIGEDASRLISYTSIFFIGLLLLIRNIVTRDEEI